MFAPTALACRPVCTVEISADCVVNSLLFLLRARKLCCKCHAPCVAERYLRLEHNHETRIRDRVAAGNMLFRIAIAAGSVTSFAIGVNGVRP